ncbi:hypothetical protein I8H83_00820 [Candidatus Saccharibacteria bacterium]|nr:hypothetical protein [Candidatus Saccharibacteria bacterium]
MGKIVEAFYSRTESLKVIFESYSSLHEVYRGVLVAANVSQDKMALYDKTKKSAKAKQQELSDSLHTQAFILMTGGVEALLKDVLEDLILENLIKMNNIGGIVFTLDEMKKIIEKNEQGDFVSIQLAESVIRQIFNNKNANEKINFQNIQTTAATFQRMFGIDISSDNEDLLKRIALIWMKRHVLVHSDGVVDARYLNNSKKIVASETEREGERIVITKSLYDEAKDDFIALFCVIEDTITKKGLKIDGIG